MGQWLLIFNNADDVDRLIDKGKGKIDRHDLKDYLLSSSHGCITLTTRSRKIAVRLTYLSVIEA